MSISWPNGWLSFPFSFQPANGQEKPETSLFRFLMGARLLFWRQEPDEVSAYSSTMDLCFLFPAAKSRPIRKKTVDPQC